MKLENVWDYIINNKEWVFSGIGLAVVSLLVKFISPKTQVKKMKQSSGKNSTNIQIGGDYNDK